VTKKLKLAPSGT